MSKLEIVRNVAIMSAGLGCLLMGIRAIVNVGSGDDAAMLEGIAWTISATLFLIICPLQQDPVKR